MEKGNKKSILIATGLYPPDVGGPATYSRLLEEELPQYGWQPKILSFGEVRHLPKIIRHIAYGWKVFSLLPSHQTIYVQDPVSVGLPVCIACWLRRREFILKIVGDYAWEQGSQRFGVKDFLDDFAQETKGYAWPVLLLKKIQLGVASRARKIIVPSNYLKKIVSFWGVETDKIKVVYNAFQVQEVSLTKEQARQTLGLNSEDIVLISAGRLVPWKGFSLLIEIMPEIIKAFPKSRVQLFIAGGGPEENSLKKKVADCNLASAVTLAGQLDKSQLFKYLRAADLFVLNTAYEGLSHQLLEVMSLGTMALVTNIGGNPELINDNRQLFEYNNKDQLIEAIRNLLGISIAERDKLIEAQKYVNREFTKERMVKDLIRELEQ